MVFDFHKKHSFRTVLNVYKRIPGIILIKDNPFRQSNFLESKITF